MKSFQIFAYEISLPFKLKKIEIDFELEMDKGENKNREMLKDLAKQKKEVKSAVDSLPADPTISREDILADCNLLLTKLKDVYSDALAEDSGSDENIEQLIENVKRVKEKITNSELEALVDNVQNNSKTSSPKEVT